MLHSASINYRYALSKQSVQVSSKSEWEKPTVADKVVEWAGVVGKHISWEFKNTTVGVKNTEGKLQGK